LRVLKQTPLPQMSSFAPHPCTPHHFDIRPGRRGTWVARDRDGLTGGTFITCKDALRFALFETGGDSAHVHLLAAGENGGQRSTRRSGRARSAS